MNQQGRRVYADDQGNLYLAEGDYGYSPKAGYWHVRPPGCHAGGIKYHEVEEHPDGTISVSPSILLRDADENGNEILWHGFLKHGEWRPV